MSAMNNLERWIDPRVNLVKPESLHAYLRARGWREKPSSRPQLLLFEEPAERGQAPVVQAVPAKEGGSDYTDSVIRAITNLAAIEDRFAGDVLRDVLEHAAVDHDAMNGAPEGDIQKSASLG